MNVKKIVFAIILCFSLIAFFYFYLMVELKTYGLYEKLSEIEEVKNVSDYTIYDGEAFFTVLVDQKNSIEFGHVTHKDFDEIGRMTIQKINGRQIECINHQRKSWSNGFSVIALNKKTDLGLELANLPDVISNLSEVYVMLDTKPLQFEQRLKDGTIGIITTCSMRGIKGSE